jgi:outer membrane protein assembly factor BamD (BamD/ComL family)
VLHHRQAESDEAWSQLGNIQGQLMQSKWDDAKKSLTDWESRFRGTDATSYAKFMKADLLYRTTDYTQAAQVYGDLAQSAKPEILKPLALSAEAASEEMAGHLPQALALIQLFLDRYPDHFLAAPRYISHARLLELTGDKTGAIAVYERFILLFPQSPWTALAHTRLQTLGGSPTSQPMPAVMAPSLTTK